MFDDQQGLLALSRAATVSGAMGAKCALDSECQTGLTCHAQGAIKYCSAQTCASGTACENHMLCQSNGFCEYPSGKQLGAVGLHEDCSQNYSCDTGLICVGVGDKSAYCFTECTQDKTSCPSQENCHQLRHLKEGVMEPINEYACMQEMKEGEKCGQTITCQTGLTCTGGLCVVTPKTNSADTPPPVVSSEPPPVVEHSSCSSVSFQPEIWLLLCLLGILIHRPKKKC